MKYWSMPKWRHRLRYRAYLEIESWREKRQRIMRKSRGRCQICAARATAVHHERYRGLGRERDTDLTAVCSRCDTSFTQVDRSAKCITA